MIIIGNIIIKITTIIITFSIFIQWGGSMVLVSDPETKQRSVQPTTWNRHFFN